MTESGNPQSLTWEAPWWRTLVFGLVVIAAVFVAYLIFDRYLRPVVTILLLALMFTYLLQPVVERIVGWSAARFRHTTRVLAVLLLYISLGALLYVIGVFTAKAIVQEIHDLHVTLLDAQQHLPDRLASLKSWYEDVTPIPLQEWVRVSIDNEINKIPDKYGPVLNHWVVNFLQRSGRWIGALLELIFVPLIAFYLLIDGDKLHEQVLGFIPPAHRRDVQRYAAGMGGILQKYVRSQLLLCTIAWVVITLGLLLMGIPGAWLLGLFAGLSRAIPVIGPVVGGVPVLTAVFLDPQLSGAFWWVLIAFMCLHLFESKYLMPRILGDNLGVHPVLIIVSLMVGYQMLGLLGMFIAPPAIAMVRFVLAVRRGELGDDTPAPTADAPPT